ncbi:pilus assembly PilX N-terminal domain-containing protein [bacterium]|nr:pilus assembly PilX N-terminal domain-containing protein [bacterium]
MITTLMMSVVLLMMLVSLVRAVTTQDYLTRGYHDNVAAMYVAESGLADVMSHLEIDGSWQEGFNGEPMQNRPGKYWVKFFSGGGQVPDDASINNIIGNTARPGPRGRVVPKGSALIVVTARVGAAQRQLEAIINSSGVINVEYPLMTSGNIELKGAVTIDGIHSLQGYERVAAGIHSNSRGSGTASVTWEPSNATDKAVVTGKVSSADSRPVGVGIDFGSDASRYDVGAFERAAAQKQFPGVGDIDRQVSLHAGDPAPTIQTAGTTTLPAGKYHKSGNLSVNGDLALDGGELFVDGDLTINGGISGQGAIWASGKVTFKGDATLQSSEKAAVMSKQGVNLLGFNGEEYMEAFAQSDPEVRVLWDATKQALGDTQDLLQNGDPATIVGAGGPLDVQARKLAYYPDSAELPIPVVNPEDALVGGNYLGKLQEKLSAQSQGPSRDFMIRKLGGYKDFFGANTAGTDATVANQFFNRPRVMPGAFAAVVNSSRVDALSKLTLQVSNVSYAKAGSSYFQGVIYTNGHVFAANSVTTLGAIMVDGRGRTDVQPNPLDPSETFKPGQLVMRKGANLTFVEEFFEDGDNALRIRGPVRVRTWASR